MCQSQRTALFEFNSINEQWISTLFHRGLPCLHVSPGILFQFHIYQISHITDHPLNSLLRITKVEFAVKFGSFVKITYLCYGISPKHYSGLT